MKLRTALKQYRLIPIGLLSMFAIGAGLLSPHTHANAAPAGPAGISSGLEIWLSASEGVKAAGLVDATNGQNVARWDDLSSEGRNASPSGSQAVFSDTGLNYNPTLTFTDDNYTASNAGLPSGGADRSIFVVASANAGGWRYVLGAGTFGGGNGFDFGHNSGNQSVFITTHSSQEASTGSWNPYGAARLAYGAVSGASLYIAVNGSTPIIGSNPGGVNTVHDGSLNIGANSGAAEMWNGNISEVIMYDRVVTVTERQRINSYLALKYGFSLEQSPAQSYLASGSNLMWDKDAAGASTYDNGLFGIGRDDASGLSQVKSRGQTTTNVIILEGDDEGTNTDPDFADIADLEFLVIGDDGGAATWTTTGAPNGYSILSRTWKKQEQGNVGPVSLSFDVADPDFNIPGALGDGQYYFIYDTNNNGSLSDETPQSLSDQGSNLWKTVVDFGSGGLFTLAATSRPALNSMTPADNATGVSLTTNLVMNFSRPVEPVSGNLRIYRASDDSLFESISVTSGQVTGGGTATITVNPNGTLSANSEYYVLLDSDAFDDVGVYTAGITSAQTWNFETILTDNDSDGVDDSTEDAGPNGGDGNDDGTPDSEQTHVTSLPNQIIGDGAYITIQTDNVDCDTLSNVSVVAKSSLGTDSGYEYPVGLIDFGTICAGNGDSTEVTIYYDRVYDTSEWTARKYINSAFRNLTGAVFGTADVGGTQVTTMTYTLVDGGLWDADGTANGEIIDPAGPGLSTATIPGAPNTGLGAAPSFATMNLLPALFTLVLIGFTAVAVRTYVRSRH